MGIADFFVALLSAPIEFRDPMIWFPPLGALGAAFLVLYGICRLACEITFVRWLRFDRASLSGGLAASMFLFFLLTRLTGLIRLHFSLSQLLGAVVLFLVSLAAGAGIYWIGTRVPAQTLRAAVLGIALAVPLVFAGTAVFVWLHVYLLGSFLSLVLVLTLGGLAAFLVLTAWLARRAARRPMLAPAFLGVMAGLVWCGAGYQLAGGAIQTRRQVEPKEHSLRHVILIIVDTLRADSLSVYGASGVNTPHIDALARDGILFRNAYSVAPWTLPSVASILTGLPPQVHLTNRLTRRLPDQGRTLAEYMSEAGYQTAGIGSNSSFWPIFNLSQGFGYYDFYPRGYGGSIGERLFHRLFPNWIDPSTDRLTKLATEWVEENQSKDFFLWIHYFDPHMPYAPPERFLPEGPRPPAMANEWDKTDLFAQATLIPPLPERRWIQRLYEGEVRYVDENIGRLVASLKQLGLYEDALIILTSDHGEEFWEHGGIDHGHTLYDELLRVPLIIKLPGSASRGEIKTPVASPSLMPTILDLCDIPFPADRLAYGSLTGAWSDDGEGLEPQAIVSSAVLYYENRNAVILDGKKYILASVSGREEFYNLEEDPEEKRPRVGSAREEIQRAKRILAEHMELSSRLRKLHGIEQAQELKQREALQIMKALGYVQ